MGVTAGSPDLHASFQASLFRQSAIRNNTRFSMLVTYLTLHTMVTSPIAASRSPYGQTSRGVAVVVCFEWIHASMSLASQPRARSAETQRRRKVARLRQAPERHARQTRARYDLASLDDFGFPFSSLRWSMINALANSVRTELVSR